MNKDDLITLNDGEYFIMTTMNYNNTQYGFANKIDENDNSLNVYKIVTYENNDYKTVEDQSIINVLLPLFEEKITSEFEKMKNEGNL